MILRLYFWQEKREDGLENYGDLMSKFIVKRLTNKIIITAKHPLNKFLKRIFKTNYIAIGSIIGSAGENSIIWGSGILFKEQYVKKATFKAVRGPKTRQRLLELGYKVPEIYGDPGILLPKYIAKKTDPKHDIGIIPHFVDYEAVNKIFINNPRVKVIKLLTHSVEKTTLEILDCKQLISSSLHGVIIGQAYRIPTLWIKFSNKLSGDNIKFYDYYESMNIKFDNEIYIAPEKLNEEILKKTIESNKNVLLQEDSILEKRQIELLKNSPF